MALHAALYISFLIFLIQFLSWISALGHVTCNMYVPCTFVILCPQWTLLVKYLMVHCCLRSSLPLFLLVSDFSCLALLWETREGSLIKCERNSHDSRERNFRLAQMLPGIKSRDKAGERPSPELISSREGSLWLTNEVAAFMKTLGKSYYGFISIIINVWWRAFERLTVCVCVEQDV